MITQDILWQIPWIPLNQYLWRLTNTWTTFLLLTSTVQLSNNNMCAIPKNNRNGTPKELSAWRKEKDIKNMIHRRGYQYTRDKTNDLNDKLRLLCVYAYWKKVYVMLYGTIHRPSRWPCNPHMSLRKISWRVLTRYLNNEYKKLSAHNSSCVKVSNICLLSTNNIIITNWIKNCRDTWRQNRRTPT